MNVASLELCRELYELSGWDKTDYVHYRAPYKAATWYEGNADVYWKMVRENSGINLESFPAYDLGYLLWKLPRHLKMKHQVWHLLVMNGDVAETNWIADYVTVGRECWLHEGDRARLTEGATPEDAAAKLAIELFKQGILTAEDQPA
jgi:hypothetical protein